jgi:hypothetical protein
MRIVLLALVLLAFARPATAQEGIPQFGDLIADCSQSTNADCSGQQQALEPQWQKALRGDYLSLKNFAFCLNDGCYGAFKPDPVMACALRIVIAARAGMDLAQEDRQAFQDDCDKLDTDQQQLSKLRARSLYRGMAGAP